MVTTYKKFQEIPRGAKIDSGLKITEDKDWSENRKE